MSRSSIVHARWALFPAILVLLASGIVGAFTVHKPYPSHWDARVAKLAAFVEHARALHFKHPVPVEFVTKQQYEKLQTTDASDVSDEDRQDTENFEGQARALGLISKDTNVFNDLNTITSGGTLAYYDDYENKMVIRGTKMTVGLRVTIAHELTHALQDQNFDIGRSFDSDGANSFFQGLIEGDAVRIEDKYIDSLSEKEQNAYYDENNASYDEAQQELKGVAPALLEFFDAPYSLGESLTMLIAEDRGTPALDALFRHPLDSDEGLFNAFAALDHQRAKHVDVPVLRQGEKKTDEGDFGSLQWYLVLSSFIDQRTAMQAVDGWGGDAYLGYKRDDRHCIRIAFEGDQPSDNTEMAGALNQWKTAFTQNSVFVEATPTRVVLDACEADSVPTPRPDSANALALPATRLELVSEILAAGESEKFTECVARNFVAQVPLQLLASESETEQEQVFQLAHRIGDACKRGQLT